MANEEIKISDKSVSLIEKQEVGASIKIKAYKNKLEYMKKKHIPQKPIKEVLTQLFTENNLLSKTTRDSISKILYCQKDRIVILITDTGKDIIWNRDKLVNNYGWFFFVSKTEEPQEKKKKKKKAEEKRKEEITVDKTDYQYDGRIIPLTQKRFMRPLYHTKEYFQYRKLINSKKIPQIEINQLLDDFFLKYENVPIKEKKVIGKINFYNEEKVVVIKSLIGDKMYENLEDMVRKYGWYFYITGVPVGDSEICKAIDKIEKRFNKNYFENISLNNDNNETDIRVSIYPIVLKPNHNCHILGLGNLNILLDCGISDAEESEEEKEELEEKEDSESEEIREKENDFEHIENYLNEFYDLISGAEEYKKLLEGNKEISKQEYKEQPEISERQQFNQDETPSNQTSEVEPDKLKPKIDAVFISHSHYDHISGLKKLIQIYPEVPVLCSRITMDLFLLRDSKFLKQENREEIEEEEYRNILKNVIYVENGEKIEFKDKNCYLAFYHGGHMPGALMLLAKTKNFRFLYTGDYTYWDVTPFAGTRRFLEQISRPIDYLLIDGTSANEDFGNFSDQFHSLILFLEQKAEYEDSTLIGADPSSLAITFMLIFWRYFRKLQLRSGFKKRPNIYVDMMVKKNIEVINHRYEYIYGPISRLIRDKANPFNSIKFRWFSHEDLDFLRTRNNIIISHPPDLSYGIIRNIINVIGRNPHNLVFLSGAIHEQPGLDLIDGAEEIVFSETWKVPFRALLINTFVPHLKIKLHADRNQLAEMIKNLEPKEVCFFHQKGSKLIEAAEYVKTLGVEKVSIPVKRKLKILN